MSDVHAVSRVAHSPAGACCWQWDWEDCRLICSDRVLPGGQLCADHYIEFVQASPDPDAAPVADVRSFDARVVSLDEVTAQ